MLSVTLNSQSPPIRFKIGYQEILERYGELSLPLKLDQLDPSLYQIAVGGVPRMMLQMINYGKISKARWITLGPNFPPEVEVSNFTMYSISPDPETLKGYTRFKEGLYNEMHKVSKYDMHPRDYIHYAKYNWMSAEKMLEFMDDTDVYFAHDFQQLMTGNLIGPSAPVVLWHHIPIVPENLGPTMRDFFRKSLEGFDHVIVSTRRDLEGVIRMNPRVNVSQIYPFIDPNSLPRASRSDVERVASRFGLREDDKVILVVARMEPVKSQDVAIEAMSKVEGKLVLAGNGSFTSTNLGTGKANKWVSYLKEKVKELRLEDKVIFTGYIPDEDLASLYQRSDVVVLPSNIEGFGLVVCEGWAYGKPVVVSKGAGASEIVMEDSNGYLFEPGNYEELATKINLSIKNRDRVGEMGKATMRPCTMENSIPKVMEVLERAMSPYRKPQ